MDLTSKLKTLKKLMDEKKISISEAKEWGAKFEAMAQKDISGKLPKNWGKDSDELIRRHMEMLELTEATFPLTDDQAYRLAKRWLEPVRLRRNRWGYVNPLQHVSFPA